MSLRKSLNRVPKKFVGANRKLYALVYPHVQSLVASAIKKHPDKISVNVQGPLTMDLMTSILDPKNIQNFKDVLHKFS